MDGSGRKGARLPALDLPKTEGLCPIPCAQDQELADSLSGLKLGGPFINQAKFWETEGGGDNPGDCAPLLNRNSGALSTDVAKNADVLKRAAGWAALCGADKVDKVGAPAPNPPVD
jgi:hypothetical protein